MQMKPAPSRDIRRIDLTLPSSIGLHAARLIDQASDADQRQIIYVAEGENRAEQIARALEGLAPELEVCLLPPWDCLPYDNTSPSREAMGRRMSVLRRMCEAVKGARLLITSSAAIVQRVPPRSIWKQAGFHLETGKALSQDELELYLLRVGYILDERVDEPGEAAIRGQVIDIFPASSSFPYRIEHDGQVISSIRSYDPVSQRTEAEVETLLLDPASEILLERAADGSIPERFDGIEHKLPDHYASLETIFDYWPDAHVVMSSGAEERRQLVMEQIADAYESRTSLRSEGSSRGSSMAPGRLFVEDEEWQRILSGRCLTLIHATSEEEAKQTAVPRFASASKPTRALATFVEAQQRNNRKILLAAATKDDLNRIRRRAQSLQLSPAMIERWSEAVAGMPKGTFAIQADIRSGFIDDRHDIAVVAASDILGSRASSGHGQEVRSTAHQFTDMQFQIGDAVIHVDHGLGLLEGTETINASEEGTSDTVRLIYAGDTTLMIPAADMGRVWRYGRMSDSLQLDKLKSDAWAAKLAAIEAEIRETAEHLSKLVKAREAVRLEPLVPPRREYERFVARFPFSETPDQLRAIGDVFEDLASGHPMDRLVCGDVGFGKTEIALRAAAAAALSGKQVAVIAPTTVLTRQHVRSFQRRFAGFGIEVAHLSRLVTAAEARAVKKGLADGSVRIVIGTHALAAKGVAFKDLGLVIVDEEQRFGAAHKSKLRAMASGGHVLTLTATPIPRTLQSALVGLQELSIIATPPARRQPIRTFLKEFDATTVRQALMREHRRRGQSFVVCSRVEDIDPMRKQLAKIVPELKVLTAHGQMPPAETDDVMVRFADGEGDILLATNIIESGLDVPRANTMLVWLADRFGLSQLHQLRGRVGRGRIRGTAYLLTEPKQELPQATKKRLRTLEALDRLGAGFAISAQDLDQRGAGALLGEEQAGHINLVGADLYQHLLKRVLRGESYADDWTPELNIGLTGSIPAEYVNEPEVRINIYARIARMDVSESIDDLEEEIEDRFGPLPDALGGLLRLTKMRQISRRLGIARIDAGPQAIALSFRPGAAEKLPVQDVIAASQGTVRWSGERLILDVGEDQVDERERHVLALLARLER
ncbi:transcription-repair coupling factor (superfamily II helicase) [Microvirga lupini]|uniref:Transcription-repair-coupling factor n=1 Tax=Microvirga lupini TaxID=420324 RepID=A0A7W4VKI0_9HYPH|nr:transcription-repair coupling factor [Microvirga lupini]MBB3018257.1 transcription-repair coupling factor (superfamily II helicase) [Microvirga lupini]